MIDRPTKALLIGAAVLVALAIFWHFLGRHIPWSKIPLGRLPGDINIQREGSSFHFPVVTGLILSIVLSLLLNLFRR